MKTGCPILATVVSFACMKCLVKIIGKGLLGLHLAIWPTVFGGCTDQPGMKLYRLEGRLNLGTVQRFYIVKLPKAYYEDPSRKFPVVLALHGTGGSAAQMESTSELNVRADQSDFIVVYPEGVRSDGVLGIRSWNAGNCCDYAMRENVDDVGFIARLLDHLTTTFKVDERCVYVTGMSNGGMMAYRLACELSTRVTAIAAVSSTMMTSFCQPSRPVPVLHIHSAIDTKIPYEGGPGIGSYNFMGVDSVLNTWAVLNGCAQKPVEKKEGGLKTLTWESCGSFSVVKAVITPDGGHSWPGGKQPARWSDKPSELIRANDLIWDFFREFQLTE